MTILIPREALLPDLFPSSGDELYAALIEYYSVGPVLPRVQIENEVIRIDVDIEQSEAYKADYDKAVAFAERGKYLRAREVLERLVKMYTTESDLYRMLAQTYFETGDREAAVNYLIDALRWNPENSYALILMGNIQYRMLRDMDAAKRYYDLAIAIDPDDHLTLNNLGAVMMELKRPSEAERYFQLATEAEPDYPNTHLGLALVYAHQEDLQAAFLNAVRALKRSNRRDQVYDAALDTAQKAAAQFTRNTHPESLFQPYLDEVAAAAGKPIRIETADGLSTEAVIEIAEYRGREQHLVKYQPSGPGVAHLVCHEIAHLDLILEARAAHTNMVFTSRDTLREQFKSDHANDIQKFVRQGLSRNQAEAFIEQLFDGLNKQVFNAPIDLFIEDRLYRNRPLLRPVQFASLFAILTGYVASATSKKIRKMTPHRVFKANTIYNLVHALQFKDLFGVELIPDFKVDRRLLREAERLYSEFLEVREDKRPGEEYEFVQDWAEKLGVDAYFELVGEDDVDAHEYTFEREPDAVLARIEADPLNLADANRAPGDERKSTFSIEGSPMASMAVTMYILDALKLFDQEGPAFVKSVTLEVAMLGNFGLDADDSAKKYALKSVPGKKFSALHLLAYMYVGFKQIDPSIDSELQFDDEYAQAKLLMERGDT